MPEYLIVSRGRPVDEPLMINYVCPTCHHNEVRDAYAGPCVCYGVVLERNARTYEIIRTSHQQNPTPMKAERVISH